MPVSKSVTESYVISGIAVDMNAPALDISFSRFVGTQQIGGPTMRLEGTAFGAIFGSNPDGTKTRAEDLSTVLYQAALDAGVIDGSMS